MNTPSPLSSPSIWAASATTQARRLICLTTLLGWLAPLHPLLGADRLADEKQLINLLESGASLTQKDAACNQLKRIGSAECVPALARLLEDEQLSHSARQALETLPGPQAGQALITALSRIAGLDKAGIITSLAVRQEASAIPTLVPLLKDADPQVAAAAGMALGKLGGTQAARALRAALPDLKPPVRDAVVDGLLACGHRYLREGKHGEATPIFQLLTAPNEANHVRSAAYRGLVLAAGTRGLPLVLAAIRGTDGPLQMAALQAARELPGSEPTLALAALLPQVPVPVQLSLVETLGQRGDSAAAPAILKLMDQGPPPVRPAVIRVLGLLGDASAIPSLVAAAQSTSAAEQKAAREALLVLRRGNITSALLRQLTTSAGKAQEEVIRALGNRADTSAVRELLQLADTGPEATQAACLRALAVLAGGQDLGALTRLLLAAKTELVRAAAEDAITAVSIRHSGQREVAPIVQAAGGGGNAEARAALLRICSGLSGPEVRAVLLQASRDPLPVVREAGIRALCDSRDPAVLPDLLALARDASEANFRALAIRGYVRLATEEERVKAVGRSPLDLLTQILGAANRAEDKRVVLAGLATLTEPAALRVVGPMLEDPSVQAEAAQTATQIATAIAGADRPLAEATLQKVLTLTTDQARRQSIEAAMHNLQAMADYLTAWQVAGPYRQQGKDYAALFDIAFPPERPGESVAWKPMPLSGEPQRPWVLDLLRVLGGEQCVAYLRTQVYSSVDQPALLELGSDDGIRVWLNGQEVYANNVARPLTPGSDKVRVQLKAGWNVLLLKVTQNNQGWACCARLVRPDGTRLTGLRSDANLGGP